MRIKVSTFGGVVGWFMRKHFSNLTSGAWLNAQYILRKKTTLNYIKNFSNNNPPLIVALETINRCNGKCTFCHASVENESRVFKIMPECLFKKIISELKALNYDGTILLEVNNEPFMDKRIISFHKYVRVELPECHIMLFTNGLLLTLRKFLDIAAYIDELIINNYNSTLKLHNNIKQIIAYAKNNKNEFPNLELKIQKRFVDEKLTNRANSAPNKKGYKKINQPCLFPFTDLTVLADGTAAICCCDFFGKSNIGNCNEQTLVEIWKSNKYQQIRQAMRNTRLNNEMCQNCDFVDAGIRLKIMKNKENTDA